MESSVYDVLSNLLPTIRLLEICAASGVKKVVYASSGGTVYGEPLHIPIDEDHLRMPKSAYGQSKLTIENFLHFYARTTQIDVDILRISNPYGPGQNPFGVQGIIAVAMGCAQAKRPLKLFGRGEAVRDYIFIDDVVMAMIIAAEKPGSFTTNISSGIGYSVIEIVEAVDGAGTTADPEAPQSQWWGTMEVALGDGATLDVAGEQDLGPRTASFVTRQATVGDDAILRWALAQVGGLFAKSRIDNHLVGRGGRVHQAEIAFGGGSQLFDLSSYTRHIGRDTTGDLLVKGVFQDRARGHLKGLIAIERSAHGTDSYLGEFGMLLSKKARSVTIPSLEIDQPDVRRASHASSVAPIDESQVFYLMTRGVPMEEARKAITLAFLEPVVARIPLPDAQQRLRELLEAKWAEGHGGAVVAGEESSAA